MTKNLKRYYQAWELRQQGKTFKEIGDVMDFGRERARFMVKYVNFIIQERPNRISNELKKLIMITNKFYS